MPAEAMHSWLLRFEDPALEAEYRKDHHERSLASFRVAVAAALGVLIFIDSGLWLELGNLDPGSPISLRGTRLLEFSKRYGLGEVVSIAALLGLSYTKGFARVREPLVAAVALQLVLSLPLALLVAPDDLPLLYAGMVVVVGVILMLTGSRLRTPVALGVCSVASLAWFAAAIARRPSLLELVTLGFWVVVANVVGGLISYQRERLERDEFLARRTIARQQAELVKERDKSERLLENVLPASIARRLKENETIAERFEQVSVLFADIVGFTVLAQRLQPERVVVLLDGVFKRFDELAAKHRLEKIKTIGDAYMAAAGVPTARPDHVEAVAAMALDMRDAIRTMTFPDGVTLEMRIGIETGPVVAGVIGRTRFLYDLWGDTVNTASRMESHGVKGAVHVTAAVHARLKEKFTLTPRGTIEVKGKGPMETWILEGRTAH